MISTHCPVHYNMPPQQQQPPPPQQQQAAGRSVNPAAPPFQRPGPPCDVPSRMNHHAQIHTAIQQGATSLNHAMPGGSPQQQQQQQHQNHGRLNHLHVMMPTGKRIPGAQSGQTGMLNKQGMANGNGSMANKPSSSSKQHLNYVNRKQPVAVTTAPIPINPAPIQEMQQSNCQIPTVSANGFSGSPPEATITLQRAVETQNTSPPVAEAPKNAKEKTPMCLVNELARYNKITHEYRLTKEMGPAHQKIFTVTLKLGNEEYTAEGLSIKKTQHTAATEAIQKTKYKHPPVKVHALVVGTSKPSNHNLTPTVELNALAMKRREKAVYIYEENKPNVGFQPPFNPHFHNFRHLNNPNLTQVPIMNNGKPRFQRPPIPDPMNRRIPPKRVNFKPPMNPLMGGGFVPLPPMQEQIKVVLMVGERQYIGYGTSVQAARHDAASKALEELKPITSESTINTTLPQEGTSDEEPVKPNSKSPISMIHEIGLKRNLTVIFNVKSEKGPPHMKVYLTTCTVGDITVEGEGNSKKASKKSAAEKMYQELIKLPPLPSSPQPTSQSTKHLKQKKKGPEMVKKKTRNIIKEKPDPEIQEELNPISRLIQIQQAKKESEPVYTLMDQHGPPRRKEFVIEVSLDNVKAQGSGSNKKMAKRKAAEKLLEVLGFAVHSTGTESNVPSKDATPSVSISEKSKKVTFSEKAEVVVAAAEEGEPQTGSVKSRTQQPTATAVSENPDQPEAAEEEKVEEDNVTGSAKDKLLYLSRIIGFKVQFTDFPKANHVEYLTLVTLNTEPAQLCHGSGKTIEASHDQAAAKTLELLGKLGLDNLKPKQTTTSPETGKK